MNTDMNNMTKTDVPSHEALMKQINETGFAMDDVLLYLDTHPTDAKALAYYHYVTNMYNNAMSAHAAYYGPLRADQVTSDTYWTWMTEKWPWEGGME